MGQIVIRKVLKARKMNRCDFCTLPISTGEMYNRDFLRDEDGVGTWKSHINCDALANKLDWFRDRIDGLDSDGFEASVDEYFGYAIPHSHIPVVKQFFTTRISNRIAYWEPSLDHKLKYLINKYLVEDKPKPHLCEIDLLEHLKQ